MEGILYSPEWCFWESPTSGGKTLYLFLLITHDTHSLDYRKLYFCEKPGNDTIFIRHNQFITKLYLFYLLHIAWIGPFLSFPTGSSHHRLAIYKQIWFCQFCLFHCPQLKLPSNSSLIRSTSCPHLCLHLQYLFTRVPSLLFTLINLSNFCSL